MIVVMIGPAGSGKSSTARRSSERLGIQFGFTELITVSGNITFTRAEKNKEMFFELLKENKILVSLSMRKIPC